MRCLDCDDEGLTCAVCSADREADDAYRYGFTVDDITDGELDELEAEPVAGDGFQTCEVCCALLDASESRNDGLGPGVCEVCHGGDSCVTI